MNRFKILKEAVDLAEWVERQGGHLFIDYSPHTEGVKVRLYPKGWFYKGDSWVLELNNDLKNEVEKVIHEEGDADITTYNIETDRPIFSQFEFIKDVMRYSEEEATKRLEKGYYNEKED